VHIVERSTTSPHFHTSTPPHFHTSTPPPTLSFHFYPAVVFSLHSSSPLLSRSLFCPSHFSRTLLTPSVVVVSLHTINYYPSHYSIFNLKRFVINMRACLFVCVCVH
jgi:hypothetical protein